MNLYLVKRTDDVDYDEYDSFVCVAESEAHARLMLPHGMHGWPPQTKQYPSAVGGTDSLIVELLGTSNGSDSRVVLSSFNAG